MKRSLWHCLHIDTLMSQQHGRHLAEDIVKHIFLTEKFCSSIQNSLKSVPKDSENKSELVRVIMVYPREGDGMPHPGRCWQCISKPIYIRARFWYEKDKCLFAIRTHCFLWLAWCRQATSHYLIQRWLITKCACFVTFAWDEFHQRCPWT